MCIHAQAVSYDPNPSARCNPSAETAVPAEVATALSISMRSASRLYDDACLLCTRAPLIEALHDGRLDMSRAKLIATLLPISALQQRFEADAIAFGAANTAHYLRRWLLRRSRRPLRPGPPGAVPAGTHDR